MKKLGFCIAILLGILTAQAQRGSVRVTIVNEQQVALENATVEVAKAKDSSLVKVGITDKNGSAELENIRFGDYLLKVTMVNYNIQYSSSFTLSAEQTIVTLLIQVLSIN